MKRGTRFGNGFRVNDTLQFIFNKSAGGWPLTGAILPRCPSSKIGAEPAQDVLSRVSLVNSLVFPSSLCPHLRHADSFQRCGNHCVDAVRAHARAGLDIAKPIVEIVDPVGEWI